jgi:hypothetical protein
VGLPVGSRTGTGRVYRRPSLHNELRTALCFGNQKLPAWGNFTAAGASPARAEARRRVTTDHLDTTPLIVSPGVAAQLLGGVSTKHVYDLVRSGQLACIRTPRIRIPMAALHAYIEVLSEASGAAAATLPLADGQGSPSVPLARIPRRHREPMSASAWRERLSVCRRCRRAVVN